jgi:hypothetical protein
MVCTVGQWSRYVQGVNKVPVNIQPQPSGVLFTSEEVVTAINFTVGVIQTADRILESNNWTYEVSADMSNVTVYVTCGEDVFDDLFHALDREYSGCDLQSEVAASDNSMVVISINYEFPLESTG